MQKAVTTSTRALYDRQVAIEVARELTRALRDTAHENRFVFVGGLRRQKPALKDIELLFVPKVIKERDPDDMFADRDVNLTERAIEDLLRAGVIGRRPNKDGQTCWGAENKLAFHVNREIPIDFFATTEANYFNALVMRTGPRELNLRIASMANKKGYSWKVYKDGFYPIHANGSPDLDRNPVIVSSEEDVFRFVGLPFVKPELRQ